MRLRLEFDEKLNLGYYSKVLISVPGEMHTVPDFVQFLTTAFGIPLEFSGRIWLSLGEFLVPPNQIISEVFRDGDAIRVLVAWEGAQYDTAIPVAEESVSMTVQSKPDLKIGDNIRFTTRGGSSYIVATVTGLKHSFESGDAVIIIEQKSTGLRDSLKLSDMHDLQVLHASKEPIEISPRKKQLDKTISAVRRQIEWFIATEGPIRVPDILRKQRILDLTDSEQDVMDAISRSKKLRLDDNLVIAVD